MPHTDLLAQTCCETEAMPILQWRALWALIQAHSENKDKQTVVKHVKKKFSLLTIFKYTLQ